MQKVGIEKEIDSLGRLQIPKEIRKRLKLGKTVELVVTDEGLLVKNSEYRLVSRKRVELIWFKKMDFPKSITEILLNIRIFLENFGSPLKKSILFKLLRTLRRLIFLWILPRRVDVKYHFARLYATKDAKNYRRKAF